MTAASETPGSTLVAFGNCGLRTWTTDTGAALRRIANDPAKKIQVLHVRARAAGLFTPRFALHVRRSRGALCIWGGVSSPYGVPYSGQVDCLGLDDVCKQADASSTAPAVHFYKDGHYVSKVYWENPTLIEAVVAALGKDSA